MSHTRWLPAAVGLLQRLPAGSESDQPADAGPTRRRHPALLPPEPPTRARTNEVPGDEWSRRARRGAAHVGMAVDRITVTLTTVLTAGVHPASVIMGR